MSEICGYLFVKVWVHFGVKSVTYRIIYPQTCVNVVPDDVPYPIEPYRYVLGRVASAFHISAPEPDIKITW